MDLFIVDNGEALEMSGTMSGPSATLTRCCSSLSDTFHTRNSLYTACGSGSFQNVALLRRALFCPSLAGVHDVVYAIVPMSAREAAFHKRATTSVPLADGVIVIVM